MGIGGVTGGGLFVFIMLFVGAIIGFMLAKTGRVLLSKTVAAILGFVGGVVGLIISAQIGANKELIAFNGTIGVLLGAVALIFLVSAIVGKK